MAQPLKAFFDRRRVERIADDFARAWPPFPRSGFVRDAARGLDDLELLDRGRRVADAMARHLPEAYPEAIGVILRSLGPPLASAEGNGMEPFHYLPHVIFVAQRGLEHHELSMVAQRELTRRFSCEFSIRAYLDSQPEKTLAVLEGWTRDADEHVRRLVSEGTRPRLPWAPRLRAFQADPTPVLALLARLKDDPSEYVRRSVANNLNDISKDHPDVVVETCSRWLEGASAERAKLVRHALRSLVRAGHPAAIGLMGGTAKGEIETSGTVTPARPRIGGTVRFEVTVRNLEAVPATAVLALRVHFVKARGQAAPKTFKLPTLKLAPGERAAVAKSVSLRQHTTRTHHPGVHEIEVMVNGHARPLGRFVLLA